MPRVAILGAGPAGISLAWQLRGIAGLEVHVFDAASTVGGQSVTCDIDGVSVELGTCYLTSGYRLVKDIAEEVGCPAEALPEATLLDATGAPIPRGALDLLQIAELERLWWRWYRAGQMTRPTEPDNALRFDAWLVKHGLGQLADEFTFAAGLTAQLYGPIGAVTAHSALTWMRPSPPASGSPWWRRCASRTEC